MTQQEVDAALARFDGSYQSLLDMNVLVDEVRRLHARLEEVDPEFFREEREAAAFRAHWNSIEGRTFKVALG